MSAGTASLFVIAAPSGAGKTTLVKALLERNPSLRFSISYTTRRIRSNEVEGRDYFFVTPEEFARLEAQGELLESASVFDNRYGTGRAQVEATRRVLGDERRRGARALAAHHELLLVAA